MAAPRPAPALRESFARFTPITPRWNDIDVFGHVNNAEFYAWFDTAVLVLLHEIGVVSARGGDAAVLVAESGARFRREVLFTDAAEVGLRIGHLGTSSVRYELGVFTGSRPDAAVEGFLVHVFADRDTRRPTPIPNRARTAFARLMAPAQPQEETAP
jgi:acyl-CoA thioester hydrolase